MYSPVSTSMSFLPPSWSSADRCRPTPRQHGRRSVSCGCCRAAGCLPPGNFAGCVTERVCRSALFGCSWFTCPVTIQRRANTASADYIDRIVRVHCAPVFRLSALWNAGQCVRGRYTRLYITSNVEFTAIRRRVETQKGDTNTGWSLYGLTAKLTD